MWQVISSVVVGVVLAFLGTQIAKGGPRWRALTTAQHELDLATKLGDHEHAAALRAKAHARVGRYLADPASPAVRAGFVGLAMLVTAGPAWIWAAASGHGMEWWTLVLAGVLGLGGGLATGLRQLARR